MLLIGMPDASQNHFDMNIAQAPQGPILKESRFIPGFIRDRVNQATSLVFNPKVKSPYSGMNLIKQNLEKDTEGGLQVDIVEYPEVEELLQTIRTTRYKVIGISVGCENRALDAKHLAELIRENAIDPNTEIVFGNYGAAAGKKMGILEDDENITVLWHDPEVRKQMRDDGQEPYTGEGVHDLRLFLGTEVDPNDPKISLPVSDEHPVPENPMLKKIFEKAGFLNPVSNSYNFAVSVGCPNQCAFCDNRFMFEGRETFINSADELFEIMEDTARKTREENGAPELIMHLRAENFTRPMGDFVKLCERVRNSQENIRFTIFGDLKGLFEYWKNNDNSFIDLVRGGLSSIWIGLETKTDLFNNKRGGATPEEVEEMIQNLQSLGVVVIGSFMVGVEGQTKDDIQADMDWAVGLKLAARQVTVHTLFNLASGTNDPITDSYVGMSDEDIVHVRQRPHENLTTQEIEEADKEWRKKLYIENGPVTISCILTLWDGYQNLKDSDNRNDIEIATYCYWRVKTHFHQVCVVSMGLNGGPFENHSPEFVERLAKFFQEFQESESPSNGLSSKYQDRFEEVHAKVNPLAKVASEMAMKFFVWKNKKF